MFCVQQRNAKSELGRGRGSEWMRLTLVGRSLPHHTAYTWLPSAHAQYFLAGMTVQAVFLPGSTRISKDKAST